LQRRRIDLEFTGDRQLEVLLRSATGRKPSRHQQDPRGGVAVARWLSQVAIPEGEDEGREPALLEERLRSVVDRARPLAHIGPAFLAGEQRRERVAAAGERTRREARLDGAEVERPRPQVLEEEEVVPSG
jgi:hypothetical protein